MAQDELVLVTGVSGFLGSHTTIQWLDRSYRVLGTLRNMNRADEIEQVISQHASGVDQLRFLRQT
jgi:nucleoside-diphosphate-sugar epimerase